MNVYDTANKLAQEIKESQEYKEYKKKNRKFLKKKTVAGN